MMKLKACLVALFFGLLGAGTASALSIHDFARMKLDDQADYVTSLVQGASDMLKSHGQPEQAQKVMTLFKDPSKKGGLSQFLANLKMMENLNTRNADNPNNRAPVYIVENAMELTLKDNGAIVPTSYLLTLNRQWR